MGSLKTIGPRSARSSAGAETLAGPVGVFCLASLGGAATIVGLSTQLFGMAPSSGSVIAATSTFLAASGFAALGLNKGYPHERLGWANLATLARLVIVALLAAAALQGLKPNATILVTALGALCLDGVDGWAARRQGLVSDFGARFDVEVDAAFALVLAILAATSGAVGAYVVLLGLPHYAFAVSRQALPWLNAPLPERLSRKAICVLQIAVLIALLVPALPWKGGLAVLVVLALAWSFGRDILWLYRRSA